MTSERQIWAHKEFNQYLKEAGNIQYAAPIANEKDKRIRVLAESLHKKRSNELNMMKIVFFCGFRLASSDNIQ